MNSLSVLIFIFEILFAVCEGPITPRPSLIKKPCNVWQDKTDLYQTARISRKDSMDGHIFINIMGNRTVDQRVQITEGYDKEDNKGLVSTFEDFGRLVHKESGRMLVDLTRSFPELMTEKIDSSLKQSHDWLYMIILCSISAELLKPITENFVTGFAYAVPLSKKISDNIKQEPAKKFLMNIVDDKNAPLRPDSNTTVDSKIPAQMKFIPDHDGACTIDANKDLFNFLSKESFAQIRAVATAYQKQTSKSVTDQFGKFCEADDLRLAYTMIVSFAVDAPSFFATQLHDAMHGPGTRDIILSFIVIWRSEVDMRDIEDAYLKLFNEKLQDRVKSETSGFYRDLLLKMIIGNWQS